MVKLGRGQTWAEICEEIKPNFKMIVGCNTVDLGVRPSNLGYESK